MKLPLYFLLPLLPFIAFAQEPATPLIHFENVEAANAIIALEKANNVKISYPNKLIDGKTVSLEEKNAR